MAGYSRILPMVFVLFSTSPHAAELLGTVVEVQDGDTFDLLAGGGLARIRLCGIDAPELGDAGYEAASNALDDVTKGERVRCLQVGSGTVCDGRSKPTNRGRVVAQCFVRGVDLAKTIVDAGHACDWIEFSGGHYSRGDKGLACRIEP